MLRELQHRYCIDILRDASTAAEHAGRPMLEPEDVRLASELKRRDSAEYSQRPQGVGLQRWALAVNRIDLPNIPKAPISSNQSALARTRNNFDFSTVRSSPGHSPCARTIFSCRFHSFRCC
jgi:hypothetical protein